MTTLGLVALIAYVVGFPILTWLIALLHRKVIVRKAEEKIQRKRLQKAPPNPVGPIWMKRFKFTLSDKRQFLFKAPGKKKGKASKEEKSPPPGIQRRLLWWILWGIGLVMAGLVFVVGGKMILWSFFMYCFAVGFAIKSSHSVVKHQEYVIKKIYDIAQPKLGLSLQESAAQHVRIRAWRDYTKPEKVEITVPTNFSDSGEEGFLKQFNQVFGRESAWVPDMDGKENEKGVWEGPNGWDYEEGKVSLRSVPPLPRRAAWSAHYVLSPAVAWSFFPLALGVENGTTVTHPETGEKEHVLGFDLSGQQGKAAKAAGETMSNTITKSPMVLIGGGTGGGKAVRVVERVAVIRKRATIS